MLNNNNFQLKINNFWDMVSDMNDIHMELWDNRNDSQLKPEPDAGTLEILANCDAIEAVLAEKDSQVNIEIRQEEKSDNIESRIAELDRLLEESRKREKEFDKWLEEYNKWEEEYEKEEARYEMENAHDLLTLGMLSIYVIGEDIPLDNQNQIEPSKNSRSKRVTCVTTGMTFDSIKAAAEYYGMKSANGISKCCNGKAKSAGKLNGQKLVWRFA